MFTLSKTFFLINSIFYFPVWSNVIRDEESEIKLVHVIFRHGARTTYSFYPNDPYKGESFYPFGFGGLTNEGKLGEYKLGEYLRTKYDNFLGRDYIENQVYVRSTDVTRTKMSAQLVLAGLYPPSSILTWNSELMWIPIPVSYKPEAEEDIFHPVLNCPYKQDVLNNLPNDPEVRSIFIDPYKDLYEYVEQNSGKSMIAPSDMQDIFFNLKCEADMNYTLPDWTNDVFPDKIHEAAAVVYSYHNYDLGVRRINSGYHLKKILDDTKAKIDNNGQEKKIYLYSGHEATIGYMLSALQVEEPHIPPYSSALSFEVHEKSGEYFIKLRYKTEAPTPKDLVIPGCALLCPFNKFVELQQHLIPTESLKDACELPKEDLHKHMFFHGVN